MMLNEFFESEVFAFPGNCKQQDIRDYLGGRFEDYRTYLASINSPDENLQSILNETEKISDTSKLVIEALNSYFLGHPNKAFNSIGKAIGKVRNYFLRLSSKSEPSVWINKPGLFRIRTSRLHDLKRQDLFHVPFELRSKLKTRRYSIPGLPCLYMGSSIYVCWEELGRPDLRSIHISRIECTEGTKLRVMTIGPTPGRVLKTLSVKTFAGIAPATKMAIDAAVLLSVCWPIILACSLVVTEDQATFKPEYIIPQLVLQWVTSQENVDGIQYPSLHVDHEKVDSRLIWNYAFPARTNNNRKGFCSVLTEWFKVTDPLSWAVAEVVKPKFDINSDFLDHPFYIAPGIATKYGETEFGRIQALLSRQIAESITEFDSRSNMALELTAQGPSDSNSSDIEKDSTN